MCIRPIKMVQRLVHPVMAWHICIYLPTCQKKSLWYVFVSASIPTRNPLWFEEAWISAFSPCASHEKHSFLPGLLCNLERKKLEASKKKSQAGGRWRNFRTLLLFGFTGFWVTPTSRFRFKADWIAQFLASPKFDDFFFSDLYLFASFWITTGSGRSCSH